MVWLNTNPYVAAPLKRKAAGRAGGPPALAVAAAVAIAAAAAAAAPGAYAAGSDPAQAPDAPAVSIAFPASVPVNGTGLITVSYTAAADATSPPLPGGNGTEAEPAVLVLRVPAGIEIASGGFEVYRGGVGMGGGAGEFAVFYAKKALHPSHGVRSEEIGIRLAGEVAPPRNFVDVYVSDASGSRAGGASALLETRGGAVHFLAAQAGAGAPPAEAAAAQGLAVTGGHGLPPAGSFAAHLARMLPPGSDAAAWLAKNAGGMPAGYREEVAAEYGALAEDGQGRGERQAASGASGASGLPAPSFPFTPLSSYVYGTLYSRDAGGILGGQPGALACMYDVGGDNRTLAPLVNLGDPSDPRGACAATDADGFFGMSILTLDPSDPLSNVDLRIVFSADGPRARVSDAANRTYELHAATVGNLSEAVRGFNVTVPDGHEFRRAMWIADSVAHAHGRLASEFGHAAPRADARWDPSSPAGSSYNLTSGAMTIGSVHSLGSRHGAEAVPASIVHEYAHHVLAGLQGSGGSTACTAPLRIDRPSSEECAWTDGWAHFAAAAVQGSPLLEYHGLPVAVDLEVPAYSIAGGLHVFRFAGGPDMPGNVAGALWDLYDPADEPGDAVDGNGTAVWDVTVDVGRSVQGGASPSVLGFWDAWRGAGLAGMRGVLALNGIDAPETAPYMEAPAGTVEAPYGGTVRIAVNATGAGGPSNMSLAGAGAGANGSAGAALPPPPFANMTYRYDAGTDATVATVRLTPNASDVGVHRLNVTAVSAGGLSNHTVIAVNVTDRTPPYFASVPWDVYVEATGPLTPVNATALGVRALDEADPSPALSHYPRGPLALGAHYVWWTATDASANSASARMYLIVQDTTPPALGATGNLTLAFAPAAQPVARYAAPNATDLVDGAVAARCSPPPGSPIGWGQTQVSCEARDASWNYAYASFWINATRGGPPVAPSLSASSRAVEVDYNATARVGVNATGAYGPITMRLAPAAGANGSAGEVLPPPFANMTYRYDAGTGVAAAVVTLLPNASDVGVHRLNVTAVSAGGLSNYTLVTVNVTDSTPPYFASVPWDVYVEATGQLTPVNATALGVRALDEADPSPALSHYPRGPLALGAHYVWWTATDASANSASARMYLIVQDTTPPALGATGNLTLAFAPAAQPVARYAAPNATDLVDGAVAARCSPPPGSPIGWGQTQVSCEAADKSGNRATAGFVINATRDGPRGPPAINASNHTVRVDYNGTAIVGINATGAGGPAAIGLAGAAGQGGNGTAPVPPFANITNYRYDPAAGATTADIVLSPNASDIGVHRLNVTAASPGGGPSNHTVVTVVVMDRVRPVLHVPPAAVVEAAGRLTGIDASALGVRAHDEADASPLVRHSPQGPLGLGRHAVTWNATDASGNTASSRMDLVIRDTTPPAFEGIANLTLSLDPGAQPVASYTAPRAVDLVDGEVRSLCWPPPNSTIAWGVTTVSCFAADASGNTALARFAINATRG